MQSSLQKDPRFSKVYEGNENFRVLNEEHLRLKREAADFNKAKYLTPEQSQRMYEIKKRKLEIKDRLELMMREYAG